MGFRSSTFKTYLRFSWEIVHKRHLRFSDVENYLVTWQNIFDIFLRQKGRLGVCTTEVAFIFFNKLFIALKNLLNAHIFYTQNICLKIKKQSSNLKFFSVSLPVEASQIFNGDKEKKLQNSSTYLYNGFNI